MRELLAELLAARNAGARERVAALLDERVRYWDAERGSVSGRDAVAAALLRGRVELETVCAADDAAVVELQVDGAYRSTEVYAVADGRVAELKAYFDVTRNAASPS
jgi:limonene-1,2-epoxide hydrolase